MGILLTKINNFYKTAPHTHTVVAAYSWDVRNDSEMSKKNFIIENITNSNKWKLPNSINGQQFIIQNCTTSTIFILDFTDTVIVDECKYCTIILGPIKRRDCVDCKIIVACEQFRLRDCKDLEIALYCATCPIIESSKNIKFSCFQLYYDNIEEHFQQCNLNIWNNLWYKIHDYSPANKSDYPNWNFGETGTILTTSFPPEIKQFNISTDKRNSFVPLTIGVIHKRIYENCLVVFCDVFSAKSFLKSVILDKVNVILIKSRQVRLTDRHAESLFLTSSLINAVQHSHVIGLHMYGGNAIQICTQVIVETSETSLYYIDNVMVYLFNRYSKSDVINSENEVIYKCTSKLS
ncbi:hypothetical protein PGB90_006727 [Kerria lacca]